MTVKRYSGNIISNTPVEPTGPYEDDTASGVWSLSEAYTYKKGNKWPTLGNVPPIALWAGGLGNTINTMTLASTGNASDFGDLTSNKAAPATMASSTRGLFAGGSDPNQVTIDYVTIASPGNASDFGDLSGVGYGGLRGSSDATKGIFSGGRTNTTTEDNQISYVTIQTTSNSSDVGDLTSGRDRPAAALGSPS